MKFEFQSGKAFSQRNCEEVLESIPSLRQAVRSSKEKRVGNTGQAQSPACHSVTISFKLFHLTWIIYGC